MKREPLYRFRLELDTGTDAEISLFHTLTTDEALAEAEAVAARAGLPLVGLQAPDYSKPHRGVGWRWVVGPHSSPDKVIFHHDSEAEFLAHRLIRQ